MGGKMSTVIHRNDSPNLSSGTILQALAKSVKHDLRRLTKTAVVTCTALLALTACGGQATTAMLAPSTPESTSATPAPSPTKTAPATTKCTGENATEKYPPTVFICTRSDSGDLLWMEQSVSEKVVDARAEAAALAVKSAADKAAQEAEAAQRQAAVEAAAESARQEAAAEAARQQAAAPKVQTPVRPVIPAPSGCDPNYAGPCVPIASDVDCAGGSGNGPAYVQGPVTVVGTDIYGLDRDSDGFGCE